MPLATTPPLGDNNMLATTHQHKHVDSFGGVRKQWQTLVCSYPPHLYSLIFLITAPYDPAAFNDLYPKH